MNNENDIVNDSLGAYKHAGTIRTANFTFSGNIAVGSVQEVETDQIDIEQVDLSEITFDNDDLHPGIYHQISEGRTFVHENTFNSDLVAIIQTIVTTNSIKFTGRIVNPYGSIIALETTVITFRYVPYEATI